MPGFLDAQVLAPPLWVELAAVVAGALAGTAIAARRHLDVIGVLAIGVVSGLGGGMIRDMLLGTIPLALREPAYLWTVGVAALLGFLFGAVVKRVGWMLVGIDALALGFFTIVGTERGLIFGLPAISAVMLGVITGVGGSILRDVFTGTLPPMVFRRDAPYATLSILGAATYVTLTGYGVMPGGAAGLLVVAAVAAIRLFSLRLGWVTPGPVDLTPRRLRPPEPQDPTQPEGSGDSG